MKVEDILSSPDLLYKIGQMFPTIVNETDNIRYGILVVLAKHSIEIRGQTSSGKNVVASAIQMAYPEGWIKDFTGLTQKALRHIPDHLRGLYIREKRALKTGGADEESDAEYDVKMAISEGKLKIWITVRDPESPTGWKVVEKTIQVDSFITTTTAEAAAEEYENRFHIARVRDDAGQSEKVVDQQLRQAGKPSWDRLEIKEEDMQSLHEVLALADKSPPAMIPYAEALKDIFNFDKSSIRRNVLKFLGLISACARLHYKQRISISRDGVENIVAFPEDLYLILSIGKDSLVQTLELMSKPIAETLEVCVELSKKSEDVTVRSVMKELEKKGIKAAQPTVRKRLYTLEQRGNLARRDERIENNALVFDVLEGKADSGFPILDTSQKRLEIENRFVSFLDSVGKTVSKSEDRRYVEPITGEWKTVGGDRQSPIELDADSEKTTVLQTGSESIPSPDSERQLIRSVSNDNQRLKELPSGSNPQPVPSGDFLPGPFYCDLCGMGPITRHSLVEQHRTECSGTPLVKMPTNKNKEVDWNDG